MTITPFEGGAIAPGTDGLARLREWAAAASDAAALVSPLVDTPFVPDSYRVKVDPRASAEEKQAARQVCIANATAAVLQGVSLGLDPLVALQQIYVVHGRPGMYARIKVALLLSHGHEVWTEDLSDSRAVVAGRRKGSDTIERITVTMDQARKAGWTRNDTYTKTPADMLWARAASRVCDRIGPDVLMGIPSVEEVDDETAEKPAARTVQRAVKAAAPAPALAAGGVVRSPAGVVIGDKGVPEPIVPIPVRRQPTDAPFGDDYAAAMQESDPAPVALDERQWRAINARFVELQVKGAGQTERRLAVISHIVGRAIARGSELTAPEGDVVLQRLAGVPGAQLVTTVLGPVVEDEPTEPVDEPAPAPAAAQAGDDADPYADYDPSLEMDGAEAAAEGM